MKKKFKLKLKGKVCLALISLMVISSGIVVNGISINRGITLSDPYAWTHTLDAHMNYSFTWVDRLRDLDNAFIYVTAGLLPNDQYYSCGTAYATEQGSTYQTAWYDDSIKGPNGNWVESTWLYEDNRGVDCSNYNFSVTSSITSWYMQGGENSRCYVRKFGVENYAYAQYDQLPL